MRRKIEWTPEVVDYITENIGKMEVTTIADNLGMKRTTIFSYLSRNGIINTKSNRAKYERLAFDHNRYFEFLCTELGVPPNRGYNCNEWAKDTGGLDD